MFFIERSPEFSVYELLQEWGEKPGAIGFGVFPPGPTALRLLPAGETSRLCIFEDGSEMLRLPFRIGIRVKSNDSNSSLEAITALNELTDYLRTSLPSLSRGLAAVCIELTGNPVKNSSYEGNTEEYEASYELIYETDFEEGGDDE